MLVAISNLRVFVVTGAKRPKRNNQLIGDIELLYPQVRNSGSTSRISAVRSFTKKKKKLMQNRSSFAHYQLSTTNILCWKNLGKH